MNMFLRHKHFTIEPDGDSLFIYRNTMMKTP